MNIAFDPTDAGGSIRLWLVACQRWDQAESTVRVGESLSPLLKARFQDGRRIAIRATALVHRRTAPRRGTLHRGRSRQRVAPRRGTRAAPRGGAAAAGPAHPRPRGRAG